MGRIYESITELIGRTPLLNAKNFAEKNNLKAAILTKLEYFNPAGSVKDRVGAKMIEDAESKGLLKKGATIIEPTSGNTGIGIAAVAASKGYKAVMVMPETMSVERRKLLKGYGAEIVLTDGAKGMSGAIEEANRLNAEIEGSIVMGQFVNPANPQAHFETTGPEIWKDTEGNVDIFVAGVGTGGTLTGTGRFLKSKKSDIKVIAAEPENSAVLSGKASGKHKIQGIGAGFIPEILDTKIYDEVIPVPDEMAIETAKEFAKSEGILIGISGGAALWTAVQIAKRSENEGKNIVVILPDTGERYLSTEVFE